MRLGFVGNYFVDDRVYHEAVVAHTAALPGANIAVSEVRVNSIINVFVD